MWIHIYSVTYIIGYIYWISLDMCLDKSLISLDMWIGLIWISGTNSLTAAASFRCGVGWGGCQIPTLGIGSLIILLGANVADLHVRNGIFSIQTGNFDWPYFDPQARQGTHKWSARSMTSAEEVPRIPCSVGARQAEPPAPPKGVRARLFTRRNYPTISLRCLRAYRAQSLRN